MEKKAPAAERGVVTGSVFGGEIVRHHPYSVQHVLRVVSFVVSAATSLAGAGRAWGVLQEGAGVAGESPSGSSTRVWVLRVGSYKLTRAKEQAEDWVWIVDPVGQLGPEKCLVSVGMRLSAVPVEGEYLTHAEVEPIALGPVTQSKGEVVYQP